MKPREMYLPEKAESALRNMYLNPFCSGCVMAADLPCPLGADGQ